MYVCMCSGIGLSFYKSCDPIVKHKAAAAKWYSLFWSTISKQKIDEIEEKSGKQGHVLKRIWIISAAIDFTGNESGSAEV